MHRIQEMVKYGGGGDMVVWDFLSLSGIDSLYALIRIISCKFHVEILGKVLLQ